jgi:hypothetical protein
MNKDREMDYKKFINKEIERGQDGEGIRRAWSKVEMRWRGMHCTSALIR